MNNPEYCQGIYDAAKDLVTFYRKHESHLTVFDVEQRIDNLERALEGKESKP